MSEFIKQYLNEVNISPIETVNVSLYKFKWHEVASTEPPMGESDYKALKNNIMTIGQNVPIVIYNEKIIDGRHRQKVCIELNMPLKIVRLKEHYTIPQLREIVRSIHMGRNKTEIQKQIQAYRYKRTVANVEWLQASEKYGVSINTIKRINTLYNRLRIDGFEEDFNRVIETLFMGANLLPNSFVWIKKPTASITSAFKQFKEYMSLQEAKEKELEEIDSTEQKVIVDRDTGEVIVQDIIKEENPLIENKENSLIEVAKVQEENIKLKEVIKEKDSRIKELEDLVKKQKIGDKNE